MSLADYNIFMENTFKVLKQGKEPLLNTVAEKTKTADVKALLDAFIATYSSLSKQEERSVVFLGIIIALGNAEANSLVKLEIKRMTLAKEVGWTAVSAVEKDQRIRSIGLTADEMEIIQETNKKKKSQPYHNNKYKKDKEKDKSNK